MPGSKFFTLIFCLPLIVSACGQPRDGTGYRAPELSREGPLEIDDSVSAGDVADALRQLGMKITKETGDVVVATADDSSFVDCGTIKQTIEGSTKSFPGSAPLSVLFSDYSAKEIYIREVSVENKVTVDLRGPRSFVDESHEVTIQGKVGNGARTPKETKTVTPGTSAKFPDGTVCTAGDSISDALR